MDKPFDEAPLHCVKLVGWICPKIVNLYNELL